MREAADSVPGHGFQPMYKSHPWHGISVGPNPPSLVNAYIEIVPSDTVKWEVDKATGHLRCDRPQKYSSQCPALYGFIPRTYCGPGLGDWTGKHLGREGIQGDGDPLDIVVLTEKYIPRGDFFVRAVPIGGFRLIDGNEADDKIVAVLHQDGAFGHWKRIGEVPEALLDRLAHYFLTYKQLPGENTRTVEISSAYDAEEAYEVIELTRRDYGNLLTST
jgi:inorganic pyrophosphatase